jgi:hypothetical protein
MLFHATIKVHDAIVLEQDKALRKVLGPRLQHVMESGKGWAWAAFPTSPPTPSSGPRLWASGWRRSPSPAPSEPGRSSPP